jgi:hypothetical protein
MISVMIGSQVHRLLRQAVGITGAAMILLSALLATSSLAGQRKADVELPALPPTLPGGKPVATFKSAELLEPPASMRHVAVATTPPVIDFLYYPGRDYEGKPWSN